MNNEIPSKAASFWEEDDESKTKKSLKKPEKKKRAFPELTEVDTEKSHEWMTHTEAASYLKISTGHLHNLVSSGKVPRRKFGRLNRYLKSDLNQLVT